MIEEYSFAMFAWQVVRIAIIVAYYLLFSEVFSLLELFRSKAYLQIFVVLLSVIMYSCLSQALEVYMDLAYNCESLTPFDAIFLLDQRNNCSNFLGCVFFEKFEYESMRDYLEQKTEMMHKCRSKLTNKLGLYWFQKVSKEEWKKEHRDKVF
jgi:NRPS condensation-like uncharacterized protein